MKREDFNAMVARKPSLLNQLGLEVEKPKKMKAVRESEIHKQISQECSRRGLLAFHGAMHKKSARTPGEPDYTVLLPGGKVLLVEVKTTTGNLSEAQGRVSGHAWQLGHTVHVVRKFEEFHDLVKQYE